MSKKRALDNFFMSTSQKKACMDTNPSGGFDHRHKEVSLHITYPHPVPHFPEEITNALASVPASEGKIVDDEPDLDLLYCKPFIPISIEAELFNFLRRSLFFYRVQYTIKRGSTEVQIKTPRFTTVFGVDNSSMFSATGDIVDRLTSKPIPSDRYRTCRPRPIPQCLDHLRQLTEVFTGAEYNFCLVNYYASGSDSISYHSDDEQFLGPGPTIASFSLGVTRDFCLKHKPTQPSVTHPNSELYGKPPLKLPLASGDMVLMRGKTQVNWLHSIPKRKGKGAEGGRINITFRKGLKAYATENYYQYNVGNREVWKWNERAREMKVWKPSADIADTGP